jgi:hypothetical protein
MKVPDFALALKNASAPGYLVGRYGALLPLFWLVGVHRIAALWRVVSLPRHRGDHPKLVNLHHE